MATGTTSDFALTRDQLITEAYRKIGILRSESATPMTNPLQQAAVTPLNLIIRELDGKLTDTHKSLWALSEDNLILVAYQTTYSNAGGIAAGIMDLVSVSFRDTDGTETPLDIITREDYEKISNKDETGDPELVYLQKHATLSNQRLYVWPVPSSVTAGDVATGSDTNDYTCIQSHTSVAANKPITGDDYAQFWKLTGSGGSAWVTATDYSNGELLHYVYKRPLYDFDTSSDNPDMPQEWTRYLVFRLAHDLSFNFAIDPQTRAELKTEYLMIENDIFPATQQRATDVHNKYLFY